MPSYHQLPIVELSIHCLETHYVVQHTPANKQKRNLCAYGNRDVLTFISFVPIGFIGTKPMFSLYSKCIFHGL